MGVCKFNSLLCSEVFDNSQIFLFQNVEILYGFPEYKVSLPGGSASSQNDLYILARTHDQPITIMVEGKVSEPFGKTVEAWLGSDDSEGKRERLTYLLKELDLKEKDILNKRYQLLHKTASAMMEAKKVNVKNALMLVHSFSESDDLLGDYKEFVRLFHLQPERNSITGPVKKMELIYILAGLVERRFKAVKTSTYKHLWITKRSSSGLQND